MKHQDWKSNRAWSRILILRRDISDNGLQFRYKVDEIFDGNRRTIVPWQWGPLTREDTIEQATARFGDFDSIEEAA